MKKSELRNIIKECIMKELAFPKSSIKVSKANNQNPTVDDFKKIVAQLISKIKQIDKDLFVKFHTQYPTSSPNYEVEIILNPNKSMDWNFHIKNAIKQIKNPLFNIEYFGN